MTKSLAHETQTKEPCWQFNTHGLCIKTRQRATWIREEVAETYLPPRPPFAEELGPEPEHCGFDCSQLDLQQRWSVALGASKTKAYGSLCVRITARSAGGFLIVQPRRGLGARSAIERWERFSVDRAHRRGDHDPVHRRHHHGDDRHRRRSHLRRPQRRAPGLVDRAAPSG